MVCCRKIILIAVQDEASSLFTESLQKALLRVGGKKPLRPWYRESYALVGYSAYWVTQVKSPSGKGPSIVRKIIKN